MKYANAGTFGGTTEILAADDYVAIPFTVTESEAVMAGTPMKLDGTKSEDGSDADGILLYDVDPTENPNAALVVQGVIDKKKADAHASITIDVAAMKTAVPGLIFRENIGVTASD